MNTQKMKYDTYCTHPECINSGNAFFVYPDNYHTINKHKTKILHQLSVIETIQSLPHDQQNLLVNDKNQLLKKVDGYIIRFGERLKSFITEKYLNIFLASARNNLAQIKVMNPEQIAIKLQEGDHQMLKEYINYCTSRENNKSHFYGYTQNKIKQIDLNLAREMEELYGAFQKILALTFERREDFLKVAEGQFQTVSESSKDQIRKTFKLDKVSPRLTRNATSNLLQDQNSIQEAENTYENYSAESVTRGRKNKPIAKPDKKMKPTFEHKRNEYKKVARVIDVASEIAQLAPDQIKINTCTNSQVSFEYIKHNYKNLTKIHIFHHKFGRREIIKKLFSYYKNLKVISLNCNHEFDSFLMSNNTQAVEKIEKLQLKWDLDRFFKQYHILTFFPSKPRVQIQDFKRANLDLSLLLAMKNNQSLTINNERQIEELAFTSFNFENIKILHYTKALEEIYPNFSKLLSFNRLSSLRTLHLSQINLYDNERQFGQFLKSNKEITTLVISYCKTSPIPKTPHQNPYKIFQYLHELSNLKKFSFTPFNQIQSVRAENIFCLSSLQELHLCNCNFLGNNSKSYQDSSMLRQIRNLPNLTQLSLYACNPIFNDLFSYMQKQMLQNIQFLNIGNTQIENEFALKFLPIMTKLEYLNIDSMDIDGRSLLAGFQKYTQKHQKESPLKYLSIQSRIYQNRLKNEELKALSVYIPHLIYVQISKCQSLRDYGFEDYKSLKYLVVDNLQYEKLYPKVSERLQLITLV